MNTPLLLDNYLIEEVHVETNLEYRSEEETVSLLNVEIEEARQRRGKDGAEPFSMRLSVKTNEKAGRFKKAKYRVSLVLYARFRIAPGVPPKMVSGLIGLNAPSILYGLARGYVAQATALCPWGRELLPTFNFLALRNQKSVPKTKKAPKKAKKAKKAKRRAKKAST